MPERFTFDSKIHGEGGFGRVIKGRDNALERDIAVKILDEVNRLSDAEKERFRREAQILARLSHPNIPAIYDVQFEKEHFLIVFQFVEGLTLKQIIETQGPVQLADARLWFHQIGSALEYAHALGITHRDVKPGNIIIAPDRETAYLVDFGIAITADESRKLTQGGFVIGTAGYMSPEQSAGDDVDWRSDLYSMAVTLYEALAGKQIPVGQYDELSAANESIPPQIDDLIRDCLSPKEQRQLSAKLFGSRLAGALKPVKPLSEVLAHGRLYELAAAIEEISAEDFARLPEGQRSLVLTKVGDIVSSGDSDLRRASERFLNLLLSRALFVEREEYREIVIPAILWAFELEFDGYVGRDHLRHAIEHVAYDARGDAYQVLKEEFTKFLNGIDFETKEDWYLHFVRSVLQALLANPVCTSGAKELSNLLRQVNKLQRSRRELHPAGSTHE
jgi:serine/threonine protein kinase